MRPQNHKNSYGWVTQLKLGNDRLTKIGGWKFCTRVTGIPEVLADEDATATSALVPLRGRTIYPHP